MRTLHDIFSVVISRGHYGERNAFMCNSLGFACIAGDITSEEAERAQRAITRYIKWLHEHTERWPVTRCMSVALVQFAGELDSFGNMRKSLLLPSLYLHWEHRPRTRKAARELLDGAIIETWGTES